MNGQKLAINLINFNAMKGFLLFFALTFSTFSARSHEYFFAYAELEWNDFEQRIEGTVIFTQHDLEKAIGIKLVEDLSTNDDVIRKLMDYTNQHLVIGKNSRFNYFGHESKLTGEFYLYIISEKLEHQPEEILPITFDFLMDDYIEQQNKMTFTYRGTKHHFIFLNHERNQIAKLIIEPKNE